MAMEIDVAELAGIVCEGILYGIFLALFVATISVLTRKRRHSSPNIPMISGAVVLFVLATAQIIVDTTNIFQAFVPLDRLHRIEFMKDVTKPIFAAKHAIYFTAMLVGDVIVIYRTFIVWSSNFWVIVVPVLCSLGSAVSAYQTIWAVRHIQSVTIRSESSWGYAIFSLSLAANSISISLLAYRIWTHERRITSTMSKGSRFKTFDNLTIVKIILESGFINAAYLLSYLIVLRSGSQALEIMASISTPLVGIIFATVILRTGISAQREAMTASTTLPTGRVTRSGNIQISIATDTESFAMERAGSKVSSL